MKNRFEQRAGGGAAAPDYEIINKMPYSELLRGANFIFTNQIKEYDQKQLQLDEDGDVISTGWLRSQRNRDYPDLSHALEDRAEDIKKIPEEWNKAHLASSRFLEDIRNQIAPTLTPILSDLLDKNGPIQAFLSTIDEDIRLRGADLADFFSFLCANPNYAPSMPNQPAERFIQVLKSFRSQDEQTKSHLKVAMKDIFLALIANIGEIRSSNRNLRRLTNTFLRVTEDEGKEYEIAEYLQQFILSFQKRNNPEYQGRVMDSVKDTFNYACASPFYGDRFTCTLHNDYFSVSELLKFMMDPELADSMFKYIVPHITTNPSNELAKAVLLETQGKYIDLETFKRLINFTREAIKENQGNRCVSIAHLLTFGASKEVLNIIQHCHEKEAFTANELDSICCEYRRVLELRGNHWPIENRQHIPLEIDENAYRDGGQPIDPTQIGYTVFWTEDDENPSKPVKLTKHIKELLPFNEIGVTHPEYLDNPLSCAPWLLPARPDSPPDITPRYFFNSRVTTPTSTPSLHGSDSDGFNPRTFP